MNINILDIVGSIERLSGDDFTRICRAVGCRICDQIYDDIKSDEGSYRDTDNLNSLHTMWLHDRDPHLLALLKSITKYDSNNDNDKKELSLTSA